MSLTKEELDILGNLLNDTFGKASTNDDDGYDGTLGGYAKRSVPGQSVTTNSTKGTFSYSSEGIVLNVTSICVVNLGPPWQQHHVMTKTENELNQFINKFMSSLKKEFKKKDNAGRALKVKERTTLRKTDVQAINIHSDLRTSYVYRRAYFEIN